jgi:hypothetical protein
MSMIQRAAVFEVLLTYHHVSHGKNMLVAVATCHYRPIHQDIVEEKELTFLWALPTDFPEHSFADEYPSRHQKRL